MAYDLKKFASGGMDKGIQVQSAIFQDTPVLDILASNVSQGLQIGLGPRYGISPIAGQLGTETPVSTGFFNMQASETTSASTKSFYNRVKILGVVPLSLPDPSDITKRITVYGFVFTHTVSSVEYIDVVFPATTIAPGGVQYEILSPLITNGFIRATFDEADSSALNAAFVSNEAIVSLSVAGVFNKLLSFEAFAKIANPSLNYMSIVAGLGGGGNIPCQWMLGTAKTTGDATHAPDVGFYTAFPLEDPITVTQSVACGVTTEYNLQNFTSTPRPMKIFAMTQTGGPNIEYSVVVKPSATTFVSDINCASSTTLVLSGITATKDTAGTTYSDTKVALVNDQASAVNSSYKAILAAGGAAYACIFQDGYRGYARRHNQWFDLTQSTFQPPTLSSTYTQETIAKTKTCFAAWPTFVRGTQMVAAANGGPALGGSNTGVLRANTVYEFTYAVYNKRLNFESNVGSPVKIQVGVNDFQSLELFSAAGLNPTAYKNLAATSTNPIPFIFGSFAITVGDYVGSLNFLNFMEYRFYFRQEGTFEWLPAFTIDAAKYWFYPGAVFVACSGALAASTGGQPGAFNDYSPLPKDVWDCVVIYRNRSFWISPTQLQFSLYNNYFAYPGRNSAACPSGQFRGALLHNYPGQAEQAARLLVFGTKETYVGRFTGNKLQTSVQVSPDSNGVFDIDGSDFVLDAWTNVTAFSYRSAAVADGILHWWGPQGIFRDDGVETPTRISEDLEPDLFSLYDTSRILDIHSTFNNQTKEIIWYYYASSSATTTSMLIYNVRSGNFTAGAVDAAIDWATPVNIESAIDTAGPRTIVGVRKNSAQTLQRAYFFDQKNRSGDMKPLSDMVVKTVGSTGTTGQARLTLASGYSASNFASIAAGDFIALQQTTAYSGLSADDMIAEVLSTNTTTGAIDLQLPDDATLGTGSLTIQQQFPIWHRAAAAVGLNGFLYQMSTGYWGPAGINGYFFWLYWYLLAKIRLWKTVETPGWDLAYRSPTASGFITDTAAFADNSDGNFQLYHPLRPGNDNMEGQGLKLRVSGIHIGHEWVLQYMEIHGTPLAGDMLKRFEG